MEGCRFKTDDGMGWESEVSDMDNNLVTKSKTRHICVLLLEVKLPYNMAFDQSVCHNLKKVHMHQSEHLLDDKHT